MGYVIDTCVWVDHLREKTPPATRNLADTVINDADALLCEPVRFELLCGASRQARPALRKLLETLPLLPSPPNLWERATELGSLLCDHGLRLPPMDLLIAATCLHHDVHLTTFDDHFAPLVQTGKLKLNHLIRSS